MVTVDSYKEFFVSGKDANEQCRIHFVFMCNGNRRSYSMPFCGNIEEMVLDEVIPLVVDKLNGGPTAAVYRNTFKEYAGGPAAPDRNYPRITWRE